MAKFNNLNHLIVCAFGIATAGCLVHRPAEEVGPVVAAPARFQQSPSTGQDPEFRQTQWWQAFQDPTLNHLIDAALTGNLDLKQVALRIEQADALQRQAGARLLPRLDGSAAYDSTWRDLDNEASTSREESAAAGGLLSWELDVWGRLRSAKQAREEERQASYFDWLGARLLLSAAVAETYFELLEQREQLSLLSDQLDVNATLLELNQLRFGQGLSSIVDVLQQEEQLADTRSLVPEVEARAGELLYTLDVLLGRPPGQTRLEYPALPEAPAEFRQTGVPSELLMQRPDLLAGQRRILALDYRVGEAIADRLPRFEIGGALSAVGDPGFSSLVGSVFGSVAGPIFDGGERRAEVDFRKAELEAAVFGFSDNYLVAVRDVETALLRERKQAERVALQTSQLGTATSLLTETRNRYSQGLTDYLPVLAAISTEQSLQRQLIISRRQLLSRRIALHRALGGPMQIPAEYASLNDE